MTTLAKLATLIEDDRQRRVARHEARAGEQRPCFGCGKPFVYSGPRGDDSGRFCSNRCLVEHDFPGAYTFDPFTVMRWNVVAGGDPGYLVATPMTAVAGGWRVACRGCGKPFTSKGGVYCSKDCRRITAERAASMATMAEVGMEPLARRMCECPGCSQPIPKWRKGRKVSKATRFCSDKCSARNARIARMAPDSPPGKNAPETAKKCPVLLTPKPEIEDGSISAAIPPLRCEVQHERAHPHRPVRLQLRGRGRAGIERERERPRLPALDCD